MKRISLILLGCAVMLVLPVPAQDVGLLEERVKQLIGKVENLEEANAGQKRQIEALVRDLQSLREQVQNQPKSAAASPDDLRELARKIQEVDEKRKADNALIAREIKGLANISAGPSRAVRPPRNESVSNDKPMADLPKDAIEHTIASGDFLSTIAAAYSKERGVKITTDMILRANPGLKAEKLIVGKTILIPLPAK
jgi:TolA-binding protein